MDAYAIAAVTATRPTREHLTPWDIRVRRCTPPPTGPGCSSYRDYSRLHLATRSRRAARTTQALSPARVSRSTQCRTETTTVGAQTESTDSKWETPPRAVTLGVSTLPETPLALQEDFRCGPVRYTSMLPQLTWEERRPQ